MIDIRASDRKMFVRISKREDQIRLLPQKQSNLGLPCLSSPFWQAHSVQNFRTFTVIIISCQQGAGCGGGLGEPY